MIDSIHQMHGELVDVVVNSMIVHLGDYQEYTVVVGVVLCSFRVKTEKQISTPCLSIKINKLINSHHIVDYISF